MIRPEVAAWSDVGRQRVLNEDRVFYQILEFPDGDPVVMCIVADGMGGHLAGKVASHWVVETLRRELAHLFVPPDPRETLQLTGAELRALARDVDENTRPSDVIMMRKVQRAVERANMAVREYTFHRPQEAMGAGSTLTMVLLKGLRAYVANVGDSRTYLLRRGRLTQLTRDHSVVAELVDAGCLDPEDIYTHPQSQLVTRCLGGMDEVEVDVELYTLESGDCLLLCCDGLWAMLRDPTLMARIIERSPDLETAAHRLVEAANHAGGEDNISVALLRVLEKPDIPI
jgi:protein phosphatase